MILARRPGTDFHIRWTLYRGEFTVAHRRLFDLAKIPATDFHRILSKVDFIKGQ